MDQIKRKQEEKWNELKQKIAAQKEVNNKMRKQCQRRDDLLRSAGITPVMKPDTREISAHTKSLVKIIFTKNIPSMAIRIVKKGKTGQRQ